MLVLVLKDGYLLAHFLVAFLGLFVIVGTRFLPIVERLQQTVYREAGSFLLGLIDEERHCHNEQDDGYNNDSDHDVLLAQRRVELLGTRLEHTVLACVLLHVEIDIAVVVAQFLVVECGIDNRHLLAYGGNEVGSGVYGGVVGNGIIKADKRRLIVAHLEESLRQCAPCACNLIDIAILTEQI